MCHVLFLDVDGVLHPAGCCDVFREEPMRCLREGLSEIPRLKVVLSSTWRTDELLYEQAKERLEEYAVA